MRLSPKVRTRNKTGSFLSKEAARLRHDPNDFAMYLKCTEPCGN